MSSRPFPTMSAASFVGEHCREWNRPPLVRLGRAPHQSARFGDRRGYVHAATQHVEILHPQRRHLAPPTAGVSQEPDNMAVAVDSSGERRHLSVAEVSAISVLALRQPYTLARL